MRPRTAASAALVLALLATAAPAQPEPPPLKNLPQPRPVGQPPLKEAPQPMPPKKADVKATDPTDAAVAAAQINDPAVRTAQAKLQLAEAELAQARYAAAVRVAQLKGKLESARATIQFEEKRYELAVKLRQGGLGLEAEISLQESRERLEKAKAELGAVEAEWKLLTGEPKKTARPYTYLDKNGVERSVEDFFLERYDSYHFGERALKAWVVAERAREPAIKGPIPDRIRAALDITVKIGPKGAEVPFAQALEAIKKETGLDISVRGNFAVPPVTSQGEELPVGAWFQLFQDMSGGTFYVREYGLLVADKKAAPPDAPTLVEFWKQKPPAPKVDAGVPKGK